MTADHSRWIVLAHLLRPQGRKGELLAELFTDFPDRFNQRQVFLSSPESTNIAAGARTAEVTSFWLPVGRNEGRIVLKFAGVDTITQAEELAGLDVIIPAEERVPLDADSTYISDLAGCTVYDGGVAVGVVTGVQFPSTADGGRRIEEAVPLLEIESASGDEILVPFARAFLIYLDTKAKRIDMALPVGLTNINRSRET
ncbi:MAG TPA: ribosome maturation factor RimM [Edaphobacter sp.]|nr:ribosome maturation factor RimM [Edaphobacter sp.]